MEVFISFLHRHLKRSPLVLLFSAHPDASFILAVVLQRGRQLQPVDGRPVDNVLLNGLPAQRLQRGD